MISHEECWRPDGQRWETVQVGDHRFFKARINTLEIATLIERSWNGKICKLAGQRREPAIAWPSHQNGFREDASRTVQSQDHSEIPSRRVFCNHPWRDTMQCWTWRKIAVMQLSLKASRFFFSLSNLFEWVPNTISCRTHDDHKTIKRLLFSLSSQYPRTNIDCPGQGDIKLKYNKTEPKHIQ